MTRPLAPAGYDLRAVRAAYDSVAGDYVERFGNQLDRLDLDRRLLDQLARQARCLGPVLDVGCGPGEVGDYLTGQGVAVIGVDPSSAMLAVARRRAPERVLFAADLRQLPARSGSYGGVTAFYVLHHVPRAGLITALGELRRVLRTGGSLLVAVHDGQGEFDAKDHALRCTLYTGDELTEQLAVTGFEVDTVASRDPLPQERPCRKLYALATAT